MNRIEHQVVTGEFKSQYEFDNAIAELWSSAYDGHLTVTLCSQSIFRFKSALQLVSVSKDGLETTRDIYLCRGCPAFDKEPGLGIPNRLYQREYIAPLSLTQPFQNPDASYNQMFPHHARSVWSVPGDLYDYFTVSQSWPYGAPHHGFRFGNVTVRVVPITVSYNGEGDFDFKNGQASTALPLPASYPKPVVREDWNLISGHFLEEKEYEDTAVLFIPSFSSAEPGAKLSFRQRAPEFLEKSVAAGKRRLIMDLSENAGGHTNHGYDLLQALFPGYFMYTSSRFWDHEALRLMFKAFQNVTVDDPLYQNVSYLFSTPLFVGPDQKTHFNSWKEVYGPQEILGTNQSSAFAIFDFNLASELDNPIRGYGPVKQDATSPACYQTREHVQQVLPIVHY
ncbi:hypothetical protein ASPCAL14419 [Aspergillus calidoustus]|uniref:Tail specific protease domain-containing protein n=1 Tax=Aspergillus calidoustus TaxID=454130 RepID=A0A0U5HAU0_ASPCI|nr:hypothetical protein ASPCAL14419 [Aspergillus calidoustus]